jgi:hypothetical protein
MKPRRLSLSALITGLLAAPGMGVAPPPARMEERAPTVQAFPAEMPGALAEEMRRVARGERPDAFGMQKLQRRMALKVQDHLASVMAQVARGEGLKGGAAEADKKGRPEGVREG